MKLMLDLSFNQVLRICKQLPRKDLKKLTTTLQLELTKKNEDDDSLENLILNAPTWNDADMASYLEARRNMNNSRLS